GSCAEPRERAHCCAVAELAVFNYAGVAYRHVFADLDIPQPGPGLDGATSADPTRTLNDYLRIDHRVLAHFHFLMNISRRRINNGHPGKHQLSQFLFAKLA